MHLAAATLLRVSAEGLGTALVLLVQERTGRAASAGFLLAAAMLPYVLAGPVLGHFLDRTARVRLFVTALSLAYAFAIGTLFAVAGRLPLPVALVAAVLAGCTEPVVVSLTALLPRIVPTTRLTRAYGLEAATYNVAAIAGPGTAAGLTALTNARTAAVTIVCIAAAGAAATLLLRTPPPPAPTSSAAVTNGVTARSGSTGSGAEAGRASGAEGPSRGRSRLSAITGGFGVLARNPVLRALTAGTTVAFLGVGGLSVIAVLFAVHLGADASAGGRLLVVFAAGALAGSLASARWLSPRFAERVVVIGLVAFGLVLAVTSLAPGPLPALLGFAAAGLCDGPVFAATLTLRQRESPPERLGQVNTTGGSLKIGSAAIGAALTAALADHLGAVGLLLCMAATQLAGAAVCALLLTTAPPSSP